MMKISFIEPHLGIYGGIRRIIELANRLTERGHCITIFHSDGSSCNWMKCTAKIKSCNEILNEDHDVIIFNDPNPTDYKLAKKAKAELKVFYVLELYDMELLIGFNPQIFLPQNKRMLILKKCLLSSSPKISNATWENKWLKKNMNVDSTLLMGGVNDKTFHPAEAKKNPNEIRILCSGDPRKRKGTETILKAIEIVRKEEKGIFLDTYHGKGIPQKKMAEIYSSADIFVEGSKQAGWNNPVAEAMACKVPVVCTEIGGVMDFAYDEKTALLVPPNEPQAMAASILRLIEDKKLRKTLGENAYKHIKQFDWDRSAKRLEEYLALELKTRQPIQKKFISTYNLARVMKRPKTLLIKTFKKEGGFDKYVRLGPYHWDSFENDHVYRGHVNHIVNNFPIYDRKATASLLDVGCGDGLISFALGEKGFTVKGIDLECEGIRLARQKCPGIDFEVKDIFDVDVTFDYLLASEVIEHLPNPDRFLQKIKGLFKRKALITTPKKDYYKQPDPYHYKEYNIYEFEELLERHFDSFQIETSDYHLYAWIGHDGNRFQ